MTVVDNELPNAWSCIDTKVNIFLRQHVFAILCPEDIHWWFSLSGGKDSYVMASAIRRWYSNHGCTLRATGLHFDQWGGPSTEQITNVFPWLDIRIVDAKAETLASTKYRFGNQAPCRSCSDVRRLLGDKVLDSSSRPGVIQVIARGLHITDTAVSLLWRYAEGRDPYADIRAAGKYKPLVRISDHAFLAKPLYYVREHETQQCAAADGYQAACCGCPGCAFPSRRDVAEETLVELVRGPLWEFDIPGMQELLNNLSPYPIWNKIKALSIPGSEYKRAHLPADFFNFAVDHYRTKLVNAPAGLIASELDTRDLDHIGTSRITQRVPLVGGPTVPSPALLQGRHIKRKEAKMIAALGPFWGLFGLTPEQRSKALDLQEQIFGLRPDREWSHVTGLLRDYYGREYESELKGTEGDFLPLCGDCMSCSCY